MSDPTSLRMLDLFAGCGGLTQGFVSTERFRSVGAVEIDPHAAATYAVNFGEHVHLGDIAVWARSGLPLAEVVVGGPPCQGFSALGRRDLADPRNEMWRQYAQVIARVRPAFFVMENVPQFLHGQEYRALEAAAQPSGPLASWRVEAHVLDARHYGSAQARKRAFIIGRPAAMRPIGPPPPSPGRLTLADILAQVEADVREVDLPESYVTVLGRRTPGVFKTRDLHLTVRASATSLMRYRSIPPGGGRHDLPHELKLPAWRGNYKGASDVMGRLRWDRPSVTIRTEFFRPEKGRFLHPDQDRPLTHYEAALLQGFPEDYLWCGSKASIARQIGNAVPVQLGSALAAHIANHLI